MKPHRAAMDARLVIAAVTALGLLAGCSPSSLLPLIAGEQTQDVASREPLVETEEPTVGPEEGEPGVEDEEVPDPGVDDPDVADPVAPEDPVALPEEGNHFGLLMMAGQSFSFAPSTCLIDGEVVSATGPGADDDSGDPAFIVVDISKPASFFEGTVRIEVGTDAPDVTTGETFTLTVGGMDGHELLFDDDAVQLEGTVRLGGDAELGPGTLLLDCSPELDG